MRADGNRFARADSAHSTTRRDRTDVRPAHCEMIPDSTPARFVSVPHSLPPCPLLRRFPLSIAFAICNFIVVLTAAPPPLYQCLLIPHAVNIRAATLAAAPERWAQLRCSCCAWPLLGFAPPAGCACFTVHHKIEKMRPVRIELTTLGL